jgi:repressor LexA
LLTDRQQQIWNYLVTYVDRHGYPPTVREIGEEVGLASPSTVHAHLANLERAGLLKRDPTKPRALELIGREKVEPAPVELHGVEMHGAVSLPLLGQIAAGAPLLAEQNVEDYLTMPSSTKGDFMLRVKGDSMIEAGILDGDVALIKRSDAADTGDIVVALIDDEEATLKRFRRRGASIALEPANTAYEVRILPPNRVRIQGKLVGLFRRY